jgi:hypothetical protein
MEQIRSRIFIIASFVLLSGCGIVYHKGAPFSAIKELKKEALLIAGEVEKYKKKYGKYPDKQYSHKAISYSSKNINMFILPLPIPYISKEENRYKNHIYHELGNPNVGLKFNSDKTKYLLYFLHDRSYADYFDIEYIDGLTYSHNRPHVKLNVYDPRSKKWDQLKINGASVHNKEHINNIMDRYLSGGTLSAGK